MAHLSHTLPWKQLASNFKYAESPRQLHHRTNLIPAKGVNQRVNIDHFAHTFEETMRELSSAASSRYTYSTTQVDEHKSIVDPREKAIMKESLNYAREVQEGRSCGCCCPLHYHSSSRDETHVQDCEAFTNPNEVSTWLCFFDCASCCESITYAEIVNQIKIMLMHDLMDPLQRLASHPSLSLEALFHFPWDNGGADGWSELFESALSAYIILNVLYLMPNIWPSFAGGSTPSVDQKPADYRRTAVYQRMVVFCTAMGPYDVHRRPHRLFFGLPRGTLSIRPCFEDSLLIGLFPLRDLFEEEAKDKHFPSIADVDSVSHMLRLKGLPMEIVRMILDSASYTPQSRLEIPDDPMHPKNEGELKKYLSYCWKLLIRCDILAHACGVDIDWFGEVRRCLNKFFYNYPGYPDVMKEIKGTSRHGNWIRSTYFGGSDRSESPDAE